MTYVDTMRHNATGIQKKDVLLTLVIGIAALSAATYALSSLYKLSEHAQTIQEIKADVQYLDLREQRYYYRHGHYANNSKIFEHGFPEVIPVRSKHPSYTLTVKVGNSKRDLLVIAAPIANGTLPSNYCGTLTDDSHGQLHSYGGKFRCW